MRIENVKNTPKENRYTKQLNVRITPEQLNWIKTNQYSATKIFQEALKELGYKQKQGEKKE